MARKCKSPAASSDAVSQRMRRQRSSNTAPELLIRQELHARGLRYRVGCAPVAGLRTRADVVFGPARIAVFVDGCFWHSCPAHGNVPKSNRAWWAEKLRANVERDRRSDEALRARGWHVVRVWEHEAPEDAAERIAALVRSALLATTQGVRKEAQ